MNDNELGIKILISKLSASNLMNPTNCLVVIYFNLDTCSKILSCLDLLRQNMLILLLCDLLFHSGGKYKSLTAKKLGKSMLAEFRK